MEHKKGAEYIILDSDVENESFKPESYFDYDEGQKPVQILNVEYIGNSQFLVQYTD